MSMRLALLATVLRYTAKPLLSHVRTPDDLRRSFAMFSRFGLRVPRGVMFATQPGPPQMLWVTTPKSDHRRVLLYFHGGGYIAGSPHSYRGMAGRLALLSGYPLVLPTYRLGPEYPLPAALLDARAAWGALLDQGFAPADIVVGGDSAGGGLALCLLANLAAEGILPAALIGFSPWTDLSGSGASMTENAGADPLLPAHRLPELVRFATNGGVAPEDPRISPLFADFPSAPPVLFQVSETEILRDDTVRMADKLRATGAIVRVETWPDAPHVWQFLDGMIPEARVALTHAAAFLTEVWGPAMPGAMRR